MSKQFTATVNVPQQRIVDMFIGACEGGSNYWAVKVKPLGKHKDAYEAMLGGFMVVDGERDDDTPIMVTKEKIAQAVELMAKNEPRHFSDMVSENDDASTADVFLQLCTFGKTIYG